MIDTKKRIKEHEGFSPRIYEDSLGYKTIGYGHLVTIEDDFVIDEIYSPEQLQGVFDKDYAIAEKDAQHIIGTYLDVIWSEYSEKQKITITSILTEMCFQLGLPRVLKFKLFIQALVNNDMEAAAKEMMDSRWAVQTKERVLVLSTMIRGLK